MTRPRKRLTSFARRLRDDPTPAEVRLWKLLRSSKLAGFKFRRQHPVPPYIADFCCVAARVIVELDGDAHLGQEARDLHRESLLRQAGFEVVRFWNSDVFVEENRVIETVLKLCQARVGDSPCPPSP
jgi:very-short-patch-repair endonuclease